MRFKATLFYIFWLFLVMLPWSCTRSCTVSKNNERIIQIGLSSPVEALDPRYATSATAGRLDALLYAKLFEMGEDLFPKPFLAESFEVIDDKTFKIILRKNLKFHDGTDLTAHDVVYTYAELGSSDVASPHAAKLDYIEKIEAEDDHQVIFRLKKPHAPFLTDLCAIGIVSKKACLKRSQQCRHEIIGSGPYRLKAWDTAKETIHLIPFADWFEGPPHNELLFRIVRDENTRVLELAGKKVDIIYGDLSPSNAFSLKKYNHLDVKQIPGLGYTYLAINVRGPKPKDEKTTPQYRTRLALADKRVRKAIAHAIDFDQIIDKLMLNTAKRASGLIPHGHWAKEEDLAIPPFNPTLAEAHLDEAGFKRQGPDNMRFKLTIATTPNRMRQSSAELYSDFLKRVGIDAQVRVKDWGALYEDLKQGQFELISAMWVPVTEPDLYYFVHHSSNIPEGDNVGGNRHGYKNLAIDALIEKGRQTMNPEERKLIYQKIEREINEDQPYIHLWNEDILVVVNKDKIKDFEPSRDGSLLGLRKVSLDSLMKKAGH
jgi:peptide/nickel transport system substrate-binding protein